jgi:sugar phosphate isomerase/epimerase
VTGQGSKLRFGVDLITFFHPAFWKLDSSEQLNQRASEDPRWFWDTMLDGVAAAGIHDIELTFEPADYSTAARAYGSVDRFRNALVSRGLGVVSGYFGGLESAASIEGSAREEIVGAAREYAEFLAAVGGKFLVTGMPMRRTRGEQPATFVDIAAAAPLADLVNRIGAATQERGIQVALHTESHSVFWTPRDVDLFMLLTDPMYVSLCPDTGHLALAGADPVHVASRHRERLVIAHWKDAIGPVPLGLPIDEQIFQRQASYFRRTGTGVVDWFAWSRLLQDIRYDGCTLLELDAVEDPIGEMTAARGFVETALRRFYPVSSA